MSLYVERLFSVFVWCSLMIAAVDNVRVNASRLMVMGVRRMPHGV